jgi:hypothetical protein
VRIPSSPEHNIAHRYGALMIAAFVCGAFITAPAAAKPPPAGIWEQFHFKDAKGHIHTVTEQTQIVRANYAQTECDDLSKKVSDGLIHFEVTKHPELANMTFVNADCATDKSGKIKIAVGAWPAGSN